MCTGLALGWAVDSLMNMVVSGCCECGLVVWPSCCKWPCLVLLPYTITQTTPHSLTLTPAYPLSAPDQLPAACLLSPSPRPRSTTHTQTPTPVYHHNTQPTVAFPEILKTLSNKQFQGLTHYWERAGIFRKNLQYSAEYVGVLIKNKICIQKYFYHYFHFFWIWAGNNVLQSVGQTAKLN